MPAMAQLDRKPESRRMSAKAEPLPKPRAAWARAPRGAAAAPHVREAIDHSLRIQPKLTIGATHDPLEREADHVADRVVRMRAPAAAALPVSPAGSRALQRKCNCGGTCASCQQPPVPEQEPVRMKSATGAAPVGMLAPEIVHEALRAPGEPLDSGARAFMEPRFGRDFSQVRIHTGASEAESAKVIGAEAYTAGNHVVFAPGKYGMATDESRRLLAHELSHTVQQSHAPAAESKQEPLPQHGAAPSAAPGVLEHPHEAGSQPSLPSPATAPPGEHALAPSLPNQPALPHPAPPAPAEPVPMGRPSTDSSLEPHDSSLAADGPASSTGSPAAGNASGETQRIQMDSQQSEAQIAKIASGNRQQVTRSFTGLRNRFSAFFTQSSAGVQKFIGEKRAELTAAAAGVFQSAQAVVASAVQTVEGQANRVQEAIGATVQGAVASLQTRVQGIAGQIAGMLNRFPLPDVPGAARLREFASGILRNAAGAVTAGLSQVRALIGSALNLGMSVIHSVLFAARQMASAALAQASSAVQRVLQSVFQVLSTTAGLVISALRGAYSATVLPMLNRLESAILHAIGKSQQDAVSAIRANRDQALEGAKGDSEPDSAAGDSGGAAEEAIETNRMIVQTFQERSTAIVGSIVERLESGEARIVQRVTQAATQIYQLIAGKIREAIAALSQIATAVLSFIQSVVQAAADTLSRVVGYVRALVENPVDALTRFAGGVLDSVTGFLGRLVRSVITAISGSEPAPATGLFAPPPTLVPSPKFAGPLVPIIISILTAIVVYFGGQIIVIGGTVLIVIFGTTFFVSVEVLVIIAIILVLVLLLLLIYLLYRLAKKKPKKPPKITHQTRQSKPAPRTRTSIGVGEEVHLTYTGGSTTWSTSGGTLKPTVGSRVLLTASDTAGSITVTAGTAALSFTVIAPSAVFMDRRGGMKHTVNQPDSGIRMRPYLLPDTVNFYRVLYHEMDVPAVATPGVYSCNPGKGGHCGAGGGGVPCPDLGVTNTVESGKGTRTKVDDCAYSGHCGTPPPFAPGSLSFSIPHEYKVAGGSAHPFAPVSQVHTLAADGKTLTTDKAAAHGDTTVSAGSSGNGC
jgi:membrane protein implicated in regulation of membrane protease activity